MDHTTSLMILNNGLGLQKGVLITVLTAMNHKNRKYLGSHISEETMSR